MRIELFLSISLVRKHWHQRKSSLFLSVSKNNLQKLKPSLHAADRGADAESTVVLRSNSASVHNAEEGAAVADEVNAPPLSFSLLSPLCLPQRQPAQWETVADRACHLALAGHFFYNSLCLIKFNNAVRVFTQPNRQKASMNPKQGLGHCPFCSKVLTKYAPRGWAQRQLPKGTREDIYNYFHRNIASKTPPSQAQCRRYLEERGSPLQWTRVMAIVNRKIKVNY